MNEPIYKTSDFLIYQGNSLEVLRELPDDFFQCCVTSPPYWGLRDYGGRPVVWNDGWEGRLGLEPELNLYVEHLVQIFREVKRVLKSDGIFWLNIADSYAANRSYQVTDNKHVDVGNKMASRVPKGLKPKDLCGIPWRVALALQDDGWWLRSEIIWQKTNAMPSSVKDRPSLAHEYIFMFTKSKKYIFYQDAVREPHASASVKRWKDGGEDTENTKYSKTKRETGVGNLRNASNPLHPKGRNIRTVWTFPTQPRKDSHFAAYPDFLVNKCLDASTVEGDCVLDPFLGRGTTLIRAKAKGRRGIGIDMSEEYTKLAAENIGKQKLENE